MTARTIAVVTAGLSVPSSTRLLADRLAAATTRALEDRGDEVEVHVIELRDLGHELVNNLLTGFPVEALSGAIDTVSRADALIVVTPIFKASYSGLFKAFFDVLDDEVIAGKPVVIAATGGTPRHSLALDFAIRPLLAYLQAVVVPTAVFAATADFGQAGHSALADRIARAAGELAGLVQSTAPRRTNDEFAASALDFERLLAG